MIYEKYIRSLPLISPLISVETSATFEPAASKAYRMLEHMIVTLELAPGDAQRVAIAGKSGELRLMLRQAGNDEPFNLRSLSKEDLLRIGNQNRKSSGVEFIVGGRG